MRSEVKALTNLDKQRPTSKQVECSIVGARGYAGIELAKILLNHPGVCLKSAFATQDFQLSRLINHPLASHVICHKEDQILNHLTDVVFLATPAEVSLHLVPAILQAGKKVIDLSGAFRLKKNSTEKWYGLSHSDLNLKNQAVYGLSPWVGSLAGASLISNPGCYATSVLMALLPLLKKNLIDPQSLVIDGKSGTTGAGKKATENLIFSEVDGECLPYRVGHHQHIPEILEAAENYSGQSLDFHMSTHLLATRRGIISAIYGHVKSGVSESDFKQAYAEAYSGYSLFRAGRLTENPEYLALKNVVGSALTQSSFLIEGNKFYIFSCIDNLLKGAASQAVENLNNIFDWPLDLALPWEANQ